MTRCVRLNGWGLHTQLLHSLVVTLGVVVRHLHRLQLLQTSLLCNLILALVGIVLQVTHVGDVTNIAHLVTRSLQVAEHKVEGD